MGTLLAATLPVGEPDAHARHVEAVFQTAAVCEDVMSRHRPDAGVSRLNAHAGDPAGIIAPDLASVLALARRLSAATDGAFDPTMTPVFEVWRRASARGRVPSARRLREALALVGWTGISIGGSRVSLQRAGMAVDLGGLGKGLALDRIAARLRRDRCGSAMLNFGESSLLAIGRPSGGRWTVVLRHPAGGFVGEFPLAGRACSTSATFGQTLGTRSRYIGHVLDPRTGWPVRVRAQVTVLARSAAVAEAASTALLVLGRASVDALARRLNIDACWVDHAGLYVTPRFPLQRLR
jgi:thiamine biosynthesis lipoprotein